MSVEMTRLSQFMADCMTVGCLRGFAHFELEVRSCEEIILRVRRPSKDGSNEDDGDISKNTPLTLSTLIMAKNIKDFDCREETRQMLGRGDMKAEPPKILADSDLKSDTKSINFLIAGYSRYQCPYVWLRSDAKELIDFEENQVFDRDSPLDLESMRYWRNYDIRPWDVLAEILTNTTLKPDENPFKIDYSFFEKIPVEESVISIGAMLDFLRKVYLRHYVFSDTVMKDIVYLQLRHFQNINMLRERGSIA